MRSLMTPCVQEIYSADSFYERGFFVGIPSKSVGKGRRKNRKNQMRYVLWKFDAQEDEIVEVDKFQENNSFH